MTTLSGPAGGAFKRALYISGAAHALLLLVIILNPSLPSSRKTGVLAYINLGSLPAGGGGGGGGMRGPGEATETVGETPLSKQTLRDLTTIQKLQPQNQSSLRYPVEKSKRDRSKPVPDKQAVVTKPDPKAKTGPASGKAAGETAGRPGGGRRRSGDADRRPGRRFRRGRVGRPVGHGQFPLRLLSPEHHGPRLVALVPIARRSRRERDVPDDGVFPHLPGRVDLRRGGQGIQRAAVAGFIGQARHPQCRSLSPPLPTDYDESYLGIRLIFEHSK